MRLQAEVLVLRGDIAESRHRVQCVVTGATGAVEAATDEPGLITSFRSAAKPFQALPFLERGHADRLGLSEEEVAVLVASHSGAARHLALVRGLLARHGLTASQLACGFHEPQDAASLAELRRDPSLAGPIYNNCSGKHTGMLLFAQAEGWPLVGYEQPAHPLQQLMRRTVAECCGVDATQVVTGIDGCSVPVFGLPLERMAAGYTAIALAHARPTDARGHALQRIAHAMTAHPVVVEGEGRLATSIMQATAGRVLAKSGAEGLLLVADLATGRGVAIKCEDGAMRALEPAAVELLHAVGMIGDAERETLARHRRPEVTNAAGHVVGALEARVRASRTVGVAGGGKA
jgi:L-asparaginase II